MQIQLSKKILDMMPYGTKIDDKTVEAMEDMGWHSGVTHDIAYTDDLLTVQRNFWNISCRSGYGSLNIGRTGTGDQAKYINVVRIKKTGGNSVTPFVSMETVYEHNFSDGFLMFFGSAIYGRRKRRQ